MNAPHRFALRRTLSITRGEVYAEQGGGQTLCAVMQQTLMMLPDTPDTPE